MFLKIHIIKLIANHRKTCTSNLDPGRRRIAVLEVTDCFLNFLYSCAEITRSHHFFTNANQSIHLIVIVFVCLFEFDKRNDAPAPQLYCRSSNPNVLNYFQFLEKSYLIR